MQHKKEVTIQSILKEIENSKRKLVVGPLIEIIDRASQDDVDKILRSPCVNANYFFKDLLRWIKEDSWDIDQKKAVAAAFFRNYVALRPDKLKKSSRLTAALALSDRVFLGAALISYTKDEKLIVLGTPNQTDGKTILHKVAYQAELFDEILASLSKEQKLSLIKKTDHKGNSVLHDAVDNPESLKTVLKSLELTLTKKGIFKLLELKNHKGKSAFDKAKSCKESWQVVRRCLFTEEQLALLNEEPDLAKSNPKASKERFFNHSPKNC